MIGLEALNVIHEAVIQVPQGISVIGFDNFSYSASSTPPLTILQQPLVEMGRIAAEMVLDLIESRPLRCDVVRLPTMLVVRSACMPPTSVLSTVDVSGRKRVG
jgi:DNA-binding LacI/PurR family transcriptional regulator